MANLADVQTFAIDLLEEYDLTDFGWTFKFDRAVKRAGNCNFTRKQISVSSVLIEMWPEEEAIDTVIHEIAHALAGHAAGHGPKWQKVAKSLGGTTDRTHRNTTPEGKYAGMCPTHGDTGSRRHRRPSRVYLHRTCRQAIVWVDHRLVTA